MKSGLKNLLIIVCVFIAGIAWSGEIGQTGAKNIGMGLSEGEIAPRFQAHDQFGHEQTNQTLAGKNGTVLLFFRSADW